MGSRRILSLRPLSTFVVGSWVVAAMAVLSLTGCGGGGSSSKTNVPQNPSITVNLAGAGVGMVTSADGDIKCGTSCAASYASGTAVTLNAAPNAGSTFGGFSGGGCTGTATSCVVTLTSGVAITATFNLAPTPANYTLTVATTGSGSGTVTSGDGMINCGSACSASYVSGTVVTLTALAGSNSTFSGWSGAGCGTASQCAVDMTAANLVTATFAEAAPPPSKSTMTWQLEVASGCPLPIYFRMFDPSLDWYWPNASTVYYMYTTGQVYAQAISCTTGDKIAYGASETSNSDAPYYWGIGINGTESCASCAYTCANVTTPVQLLECN